jgi:hypothetical protein
MIIVGLAFFLCWFLIAVLLVTLPHALLITAIVFIGLGLVLGERPWVKKS